MCAMTQKFLMMSMGVRPTTGAAAAGDTRRRPAGKACSGTEDTGKRARSKKGRTRAAAAMVACRGHGPVARLPRALRWRLSAPAGPECGRAPRWRPGALSLGQLSRSSAQRWAIADLRFAAWFLWMTPLLAALSRLCDAVRMATVAASTSPESAASRNLRTAVFSDDLTALLRCRAFSFCLLRLIWDLIFATRKPRSGSGSRRWARAIWHPRQPHTS